MKPYFAPGACLLSPHIVLHEAGLDFKAIRVDLATHKLIDGTDYYTINRKGAVPVLQSHNGERVTEGTDRLSTKIFYAA